MAWRLIVRYGRSDETRDLPDVQALRDAVMRLRTDPRVTAYRWLRVREEPRQHCPRCDGQYTPDRVHSWPCRCGWTHVTSDCYGCGLVDVDPPRHDGCADLPADAEGANQRLSRKRWRRVRR